MTTIAVVGNGRVGGNLATALTRAGLEVTVHEWHSGQPKTEVSPSDLLPADPGAPHGCPNCGAPAVSTGGTPPLSSARRVLVLDRNTPSVTSVPSGKTSVWERLTGPVVPVRPGTGRGLRTRARSRLSRPWAPLTGVFCSGGRGVTPRAVRRSRVHRPGRTPVRVDPGELRRAPCRPLGVLTKAAVLGHVGQPLPHRLVQCRGGDRCGERAGLGVVGAGRGKGLHPGGHPVQDPVGRAGCHRPAGRATKSWGHLPGRNQHAEVETLMGQGVLHGRFEDTPRNCLTHSSYGDKRGA